MVGQPVIPAVLTVVALMVGKWIYDTIQWKRKYKLPPTVEGGVPFFGNTFQIPALQQGPWAKKLAEKYGEM